MIGLLTFIRAAETDPNLVSLALGYDLTTLDLNLNSEVSLHPTFGGPWAKTPCRPQDIDYHVPFEYLTNSSIRYACPLISLHIFFNDKILTTDNWIQIPEINLLLSDWIDIRMMCCSLCCTLVLGMCCNWQQQLSCKKQFYFYHILRNISLGNCQNVLASKIQLFDLLFKSIRLVILFQLQSGLEVP